MICIPGTAIGQILFTSGSPRERIIRLIRPILHNYQTPSKYRDRTTVVDLIDGAREVVRTNQFGLEAVPWNGYSLSRFPRRAEGWRRHLATIVPFRSLHLPEGGEGTLVWTFKSKDFCSDPHTGIESRTFLLIWLGGIGRSRHWHFEGSIDCLKMSGEWWEFLWLWMEFRSRVIRCLFIRCFKT